MTTRLRLALVAALVASWGCDDATKTAPAVSNSRSLAANNFPERSDGDAEKLMDRNKIVTCKPTLEFREDQTTHLVDSHGNDRSPIENWLVIDDHGSSIRFLLHVSPSRGRVRQGARELAQLREDRAYEFTLETRDDSSVVLTRVTDGKNVVFQGRFHGRR